ncbi:endonuclease/exonuclease/phosphatase family protein [Actinokineospora sp. UTMC 2448]|uniref:endonuclease/exonuclease/phosphatase family protein n=1 Tax=Actinokineospora sp. UTMC 2448 TaxID=2268449 RepID=UPI00216431A2|nr:endonuclease/exonuclease/phosphatase family protein [Actinokineospora sp. UTMC 2448]UVS76659.1 Endonuclease/Exonuclease/phosphatase family protein [Actinokineospora sp. UTMC 2448]
MRTAEIDAPAPVEPPRRRKRRWVTALLAIPVLVVVAATVLRLVGVDGDRHTMAALALTPYLTAFAAFITLLALVAGRRALMATALIATVSLGSVLVPRSLDDGAHTGDGQRIRVMTANLLVGGADPTTLLTLARDSRVDVLAFQELTPAAVEALDAAGMRRQFPYRVLRAEAGGSGSGIVAKVPLRQIVLVEESVLEQVAVVADLSGPTDVEILSVHVLPGVHNAGAYRIWQRELADLPSPDAGGRPRILAGDFNATLDHAAMTRIIDRGYWDAAELTGEGLRPTWSQYPWGPPVTIDHILVDRRITATSLAVYDLPGSDHNAVVAELVLPQ